MLSASAYLTGLAEFLERNLGPFADPPLLYVDPSDSSGQLDGAIAFPDGCELLVSLVVDPGRDPVVPLAVYSFHCQDRQKRCVVRLDNAPHHRGLHTFPHHVHEGPDERVSPHPLPLAGMW